MSRRYIFSSESVTEGHPDKVCDTISDYVLDACLEQDPLSRVACETLAKGNLVVLAGEITSNAKFDFEEQVRTAIRDIGYVNGDCIFHADTCRVICEMSEQSRDIKQGVDETAADGKGTAEQGAGDQGLMFGFACNETPELMPAPISFAHKLGRELTRLRKSGEIPWLRPDAKTQVSIEYDGYKPLRATTVVVSSQHAADVKQKEVRETLVELLIKKVMPAEWLDAKTTYLINPTGRFVIGGPEGDAGITGRKIICDTYGGMGRHGGGAFSGKDPTKVDRRPGGSMRGSIRLCYRPPRTRERQRRHLLHRQSGRREIGARRLGSFQFQTGRDHQTARFTPADLSQDDQLRSFRSR